jgi:beta-lactam-binding protein with PASTA domain
VASVEATRNFPVGTQAQQDILIRLVAEQTAQTATTVTVTYTLTIERPSGVGFFALAGSGNTSFITTGTPTGISTPDFTYDFRSAAINAGLGRVYEIRQATRTITTSVARDIVVSATATTNLAYPTNNGFGTATTPNRTLRITPAVTEAAPDVFSNTPYLSGTVNQSYNDVVFSTGTTTGISRSGALPPGLIGAYESSTQGYRVQGAPTAAGTYSFTLTASNSSGGTRTYSASIAISNPVTFTTPNVIGRSRSTAISTLESAGFGSVSTSFVASGATRDNNLIVLNQLPGSGATATEGDSASISVYDFRLPVPNLLTRTRDQAIQLITDAGFIFYSSSLSTTNATLANNLTVRTQSPTAGSTLNITNTISFTLFDYRVAVPNVVGQTQDNAITLLQNAGFTNTTITLTQTGATALNVGTVRTQSPTSTATATNPATTTVTLTVYSLGITGRRYTSSSAFSPLTTVRRYTGQAWTTITIQKRYDGQAWKDIAN